MFWYKVEKEEIKNESKPTISAYKQGRFGDGSLPSCSLLDLGQAGVGAAGADFWSCC